MAYRETVWCLDNAEEIVNGVVEEAYVWLNEREILELYVGFNFGGRHQAFCGRALYLPPGFKHHSIDSCAGHHIYRTLRAGDVERVDKLKGRSMRVAVGNGLIQGVGHIIYDDRWYFPSAELIKNEDAKNG